MVQVLFSPLAAKLLQLTRWLLYPSFHSFNNLLCLYVITFKEAKEPQKVILRMVTLTLFYLIYFVLTLPLMFIFLPLRCLLLNLRKPYCVSVKHSAVTQNMSKRQHQMLDSGNYKFGIASANLCLLPESVSKMNDMTNVDGRSKSVGERIVIDQFFNSEWNRRQRNNKKFSKDSEQASNICADMKEEVQGQVTAKFPHVDFFVIQEAWSSYHNKALIEELHKCYPYIVHDVGVHSWAVNAFFLNSGLFLASQHPIIAVDFKPFTDTVKHARIFGIGFLMTKVVLGTETDDSRNVGYIFNTHLQSYQETDQVQVLQMSEIMQWAEEFIEKTKEEKDHIVFSFMCGDFNFDHMSPCDKESSSHKLLETYKDFCVEFSGVDKHWTVGTELRPKFMTDKAAATEQGLQAILKDPLLRQRYLIDADIKCQNKEELVLKPVREDEHGNVIPFPEGGRRRIDFILYREDLPVTVQSYQFVTRLASLTDHIPVVMEFTCPRMKSQ